ncbi:MAG: hypothetical protein H2172_11740 [Opitutus sp.]|nr:hypothetical protein [Opitutus sp.]MCS6277020.1 hypothetical protein [Opitutus sp.]MCS6299932.1 hypothetical protein [Opitutus sp.]
MEISPELSASLAKLASTAKNFNLGLSSPWMNHLAEHTTLPEFVIPKITSHAESTFTALSEAINDLKSSAPKDHDVIVHAFGIYVHSIFLKEPHTLLFKGMDTSGNNTFVVAHFTQVVASVIYMKPTVERERVITGFYRGSQNEE